MAVTAGAAAAAVERVADARLEAGGEALAIVVPERAEHRPLNPGCIHRTTSVVELLAEVRVHSADHVILQAHAHALGGSHILPAEIARRILLDRRSLIDVPEIIVDLVHEAAIPLARRYREIRGFGLLLRREGNEAVHAHHGLGLFEHFARGKPRRLAWCRRRAVCRFRIRVDEADRLDGARIVGNGVVIVVGEGVGNLGLDVSRTRRRLTIDDGLVVGELVSGRLCVPTQLLVDQRDHCHRERTGAELEPEGTMGKHDRGQRTGRASQRGRQSDRQRGCGPARRQRRSHVRLSACGRAARTTHHSDRLCDQMSSPNPVAAVASERLREAAFTATRRARGEASDPPL